jgi:predicted AAA+ superfamily ATPase
VACKLKFVSSICRFSYYSLATILRDIQPSLKRLAAKYPVVTLTGPRQSGKTTLAKACFPHLAYISLEDPDARRFAVEDPRGFLAGLSEGAILDEIQRPPELLSYLQAVVDQNPVAGRFILTGSQQFQFMRYVSQSLVGRTALLRLLPFTLSEVVRLSKAPVTLQVDPNFAVWSRPYSRAFIREFIIRGSSLVRRLAIIFQPTSSATSVSLPPSTICKGLSALYAFALAVLVRF